MFDFLFSFLSEISVRKQSLVMLNEQLDRIDEMEAQVLSALDRHPSDDRFREIFANLIQHREKVIEQKNEIARMAMEA